jgi:hypothetical protein
VKNISVVRFYESQKVAHLFTKPGENKRVVYNGH